MKENFIISVFVKHYETKLLHCHDDAMALIQHQYCVLTGIEQLNRIVQYGLIPLGVSCFTVLGMKHFELTLTKSRKSYCSTPGRIGVSKLLKFLRISFFM